MRISRFVIAGALAVVLNLSAGAEDASAQPYAGDAPAAPDNISLGKKEYSPYLHRSFPNRVLWGDTHLHTSYSTDAGMIGNFLGPDEAFRFARGETRQPVNVPGLSARSIFLLWQITRRISASPL